MGLTPFEIMYGNPAPIILTLQSNAVWHYDDQEMLFKIKAIQWSHENVWPKLRALFEAGAVPEPHKFPPGDWVYVRKFFQGILEPRWKVPFVVLLTAPMALKVDGITTWVHYSHTKLADPFTVKKDYLTPSALEWRAHRSDNLLKLKLSRS